MPANRLNCLSAGSVSLTAAIGYTANVGWNKSQLPFGWVCFSNAQAMLQEVRDRDTVSIAFRLGLFL